MFCSNCGTQAQNAQSFCSSCGFALNSRLAPPITQPVSKAVQFPQPFVRTLSLDAPKPMGFIESIKYHFKSYAKFKGRASRSEFWYWYLFILFALYGTTIALGVFSAVIGVEESAVVALGTVSVYLVGLPLVIPSLAGTARRLHDINKSGWNFLFGLIPIVGPILLLVWFCRKGGPDNKYGPAGH